MWSYKSNKLAFSFLPRSFRKRRTNPRLPKRSYSARVIALLVAFGLGLSWLVQPQAAVSQPSTEVTLVSYAVTKAAYEKIIPKFAAQWKKETGQDVRFRQSYGGSGSQTRAVIDGLEADITNLALASDTKRLEKAGLVKPGWESKLPNNSIVTKSAVVLATRTGNPKKIKDWADLARKDVKVITANPKTSGVARWNFLALWGSVSETGGSEAKAKEFVTSVFKNVPVLPKDARESTEIFLKQRQGDVLLNYENELILAAQQGDRSTYVVPPINISIDTPIAVVDKNVDKHGTRKVTEAFAKYLFTPDAQREFAKTGFRPVNATVAKEFTKEYRKIDKLYTINEFGGWDMAQSKFFNDKGVFDQIQSSIAKK
jgi:sulfate/thiosulfate transport system substrate-binding protein